MKIRSFAAELMKTTLAVLFLFLAVSTAALGQSAVTGAISGTVSDPSNAVVPNATVTLLNVGTNREETAATEGDGRFRFTNLQPGSYTLTIKTSGFADYKREQIIVEVGRTSAVEATLQVSGAQSEVSIVADLPLVNTESKEFASNINQTAINELPIK